MCDCAGKIEDILIRVFKEKHPNAFGVDFERMSYTLVPDNKPFLVWKLEGKTTKNGKDRKVKETKTVIASYCPFCGEKIGGDSY